MKPVQSGDDQKYLFTCKSGQNLSKLLVNDLVADCGPNAEDEDALFKSKGKNFNCSEPNMLPCKVNHPRCYHIFEICTYKLNNMNILVPCRTGEHLQYCKEFQCNMMFKCQNSYCIPWGYVCNKRWDCPNGEDEILDRCQQYEYKHCRFMFKCRRSTRCVHLGDLCDNKKDCPSGDDEFFCTLNYLVCPKGCFCLTLAITCAHLTDISGLPPSLPFYILNLHNFEEDMIINLLPMFKIIRDVTLKKSSVKTICIKYSIWEYTLFLEASFNTITEISSYCFGKAFLLRFINLGNNKIANVQRNAFSNLPKLYYLNLVNNLLSELHPNMVRHCPKLYVLFINNNSLVKVTPFAFQYYSFSLLITDNYILCCFKPEIAYCSKSPPWFKLCGTLLQSYSIKYSFYIVSGLIFTSNILSIFLQIKFGPPGSFKVIMLSINYIDLLGGVHLTLLWLADIHYQKNIIVKETEWTSSFICFTVFTIFLFINLLSPFILSMLSLSRLMVVQFPLETKFKQYSFVRRCIFRVFGLTAALSFLYSCVSWNLLSGPKSNMCLPFIVPPRNSMLNIILTCVIILEQYFAIVFIITCYWKLITELQKSSKKVQKSMKTSNIPIMVQLFSMVSSNIICWIPTSIIYITALFVHTYPIQTLHWTIVYGTTINSIVNPVICVVTNTRAKLAQLIRNVIFN